MDRNEPFLGGTSEIYIADADGGNMTKLTDAPDPTNPTFVEESGNLKIVHSRETGPSGERQIWKMNTDGSGAVNLSASGTVENIPRGAGGPNRNAASNRLLFLSNRDGEEALWKMSIDGSDPEKITASVDGIRRPDWWVGGDQDGEDLVSKIGDFEGNEYYISKPGVTRNWNEARTVADELGGHLVTLSDQEEENFVIPANAEDFDDNAWIGLTDSESEGDFEWVTGESLSYTNWCSGEPNDLGTEDAVILRLEQECWNDGDIVNDNRGFIIEVEGSGGDAPPITPTASSPQQAGSEFWVDVKVGGDAPVENLFGTSFTLSYDEGALSVVDDEAGDFLGSDVVYSSNNDASAGEIGIGVSRKSGAGGVDGSGVVARVKFEVNSGTPDGTTLSFSLSQVEADDPDGNAITLNPQTLDVDVTQGLTVFPGDTDNDGVVDQGDVLPLGQHWGSTGPARGSETCQWQGHTAQPWSTEAATYADANGDGTVDQADVLCIGQNWGKTHSKSGAAALASSQGDAGGELVLQRREASGSAVWYEISAENTGPLVGMSAELKFPTGKATVLQVEPGPAVGGDALFETRTDEEDGTLAIGASRKGRTASKGGVFARVKFRTSSGVDQDLGLTVEQATAGLRTGKLVSLRSEGVELPSETVLRAPRPNPTQQEAQIRYTLAETKDVRLVLYNTLGQEVRVLASGRQPAGRRSVTVDVSRLAAGIYFLRMQAGSFKETRRITVVR